MNETSVSSIMSISTDAGSIYNRYESNQIYRFFSIYRLINRYRFLSIDYSGFKNSIWLGVFNVVPSLRSRRWEVAGERENGRASPSRAPVFSCAHYFQAPATQATSFPGSFLQGRKREDPGNEVGVYYHHVCKQCNQNFSVSCFKQCWIIMTSKGYEYQLLLVAGWFSRSCLLRKTIKNCTKNYIKWQFHSSAHH